MNTAVKDVMTARVIWMERDTPFTAIAAAFERYRVSAFPVLDQAGEVIGVVSEGDLLAKLALDGGDGHMPGMIGGILHHQQLEKARATTAGDLMTAQPVTVAPQDTVEHAARVMYLRRVKHLPVVDADNQLAGIISRADVLSVFSRADKDIRQEIIADVALSTSAVDAIDLAVQDGIVTLTGRAQTSEIAHDIARRVRHIEGVVAVRDRLSYPPPGPDSFDVLARFSSDLCRNIVRRHAARFGQPVRVVHGHPGRALVGLSARADLVVLAGIPVAVVPERSGTRCCNTRMVLSLWFPQPDPGHGIVTGSRRGLRATPPGRSGPFGMCASRVGETTPP